MVKMLSHICSPVNGIWCYWNNGLRGNQPLLVYIMGRLCSMSHGCLTHNGGWGWGTGIKSCML